MGPDPCVESSEGRFFLHQQMLGHSNVKSQRFVSLQGQLTAPKPLQGMLDDAVEVSIAPHFINGGRIMVSDFPLLLV